MSQQQAPANPLFGHSQDTAIHIAGMQAPVFADAMLPFNRIRLSAFFSQLKSVGFANIVEHGADSLKPYFSSMSRYLNAHWGKYASGYTPKLATPESLSALYREISIKSHSSITVDPVIMPFNRAVLAASVRSSFTAYSTGFPNSKTSVQSNFGFVSLSNRKPFNLGGFRSHNITVPIYQLDADVMATAAPYDCRDVLLRLQSALRFASHDPLHQFTIGMVNDEITGVPMRFPRDHLFEWDDEIKPYPFNKHNLGDYEAWAQLAHEKIIMHEGGSEALGVEVKEMVDGYYDALGALKDRMVYGGVHSTDVAEVIDYLGTHMAMVMAHAYPLRHAVITNCINQMEKLEDDPNQIIAYHVSRHRGQFLDIAESQAYYEYGLDCPSDSDLELTYAEVKLRDIIADSPYDVIHHAPEVTEWAQIECDERVHSATVNMLCAVVKDMKFIP